MKHPIQILIVATAILGVVVFLLIGGQETYFRGAEAQAPNPDVYVFRPMASYRLLGHEPYQIEEDVQDAHPMFGEQIAEFSVSGLSKVLSFKAWLEIYSIYEYNRYRCEFNVTISNGADSETIEIYRNRFQDTYDGGLDPVHIYKYDTKQQITYDYELPDKFKNVPLTISVSFNFFSHSWDEGGDHFVIKAGNVFVWGY